MLKIKPTVYNIPAGLPFADCLAKGIMEQYGHTPENFAQMTIFLPSKRGIRALRDSFQKINLGKILLLPKIRSLGDAIDDEMSVLPDDEASPHALLSQKRVIPAAIRQLALTKIVLDNIDSFSGKQVNYPEAFSLAATLIELLDSLQSERITSDALATIDTGDFAENWQNNLKIAKIVTDIWPQYLADNGYTDPVLYRNHVLSYLTEFWENNPPKAPVIAAGSTGSMPASADFMKLIGRLPTGCVVLPGLDVSLTNRDKEGLFPDHPQYGLYKLMNHFDVDIPDIHHWHSVKHYLTERHIVRQKLCHEMMRPSKTAEAWFNITQRLDKKDMMCAIDDLKLITAQTEREEANVIALIIREAVENPHQTVALVTPNRILVQRVKSVLRRWNIIPNDSAGVPLADLPQGVYFKLLCDVLEENFSPISLLAFLKHPFSRGGYHDGSSKRQVRRLEKHIFRGAVTKEGFSGYRKQLQDKLNNLSAKQEKDQNDIIILEGLCESLEFIKTIETMFAPIRDLPEKTTMRKFIDAFSQLVDSFALVHDDTKKSWCDFWSQEAGAAAEELLSTFQNASDMLGEMTQTAIRGHIKEFTAKIAVRQSYGYHPRVFIWGTPEARLQQTDIVILSGLTEGSWPIAPDTGIWLSRPMRQQIGLTAPERRIGLSSHDFVQAVCGSKVFLTHSLQSNESPNIPSRWLVRLESLIAGAFDRHEVSSSEHYVLETLRDTPYLAWSSLLDTSETKGHYAPRPAPCPDVDVRPIKLGVTDCDKWVKDPYVIYCKYILKLKKLPLIDESFSKAEEGTIIHEIFYEFVSQTQDGYCGKPYDIMNSIIHEKREQLEPTLKAYWGNRLYVIGKKFVDFDIERRKKLSPKYLEHSGEFTFQTSVKPFTLTARCDRIDIANDNHAVIVDYKTSARGVATEDDMLKGYSLQMPLQAYMLSEGGFEKPYDISYVEYIQISETSREIIKKSIVPKKEEDYGEVFQEKIDNVTKNFKQFVDKFYYQETAYLSKRIPKEIVENGTYDLLARVQEWSLFDDEDEENMHY